MDWSYVPRAAALAALLLATGGCLGVQGPPELLVTAKDFRFQPERIVVPAGQTVRLKLVNSDAIEHDLTINAPVTVVRKSGGQAHGAAGAANAGVHLHAPAKRNDSIDVTLKEKGVYEVFCTVGGHKEQGMVATLVVQ